MDASEGLTARLMARAIALRHSDLPPDVQRVATDCLIDWLGCTLAGLDEPASRMVMEMVLEAGGQAQATLVGRVGKAAISEAALVNGTASHALDYDDVNLAVPGHMSVAIIPALLALAEFRNATVSEFITAFVAGYETACRIGRLVEPAHYANGFHATATIGALGAATACAHLLHLSPDQAAHALGVAATQASGLKIMFGTMAKPLHAGLAAQAGLRGALLAAKGFTSRPDSLEVPQGFASVHGTDFYPEAALAEPPGGFHILSNLFKFHAACYSTHAAIEAVTTLKRQHALQPDEVASIEVTAGEGCTICNIQEPKTDLEAKFSLRIAAAFALSSIDTSGLSVWSRATEPKIVSLRDRVCVRLVPEMGLSDAEVVVRLKDGRSVRQFHDCGVAPTNKAEQSLRVRAKFAALAGPVLGPTQTSTLTSMIDAMTSEQQVRSLLLLTQPRV